MKFWNWLSGKKTAIGATLLLASAFSTQVLIGTWGFEWWWLPNTITTLDWVGGVVTSGGLLHKGVKAKTNGGE